MALQELVSSHLASFAGSVNLPGTPGYEACVLAATGANFSVADRRPALALEPACEADVVLALGAVVRGRSLGLWGDVPLTVCGGGHSELCVHDRAVLLRS